MPITQWVDPDTYPHMYYYVTEMNGHLCGVRQECDWGGPCDWCATCSCGWKGDVFTDSSRPGERGAGSPRHALAQLLKHVDFDPEKYDAQVRDAASKAMVRVSEIAAEPVSDEGLHAIEELTSQVRLARAERDRLMSAWGMQNQSSESLDAS